MPFTSECASLFSTGSFRQLSSFTISLPFDFTVSAKAINFSVASLLLLLRLRITSSHKFLRTGSISSYTTKAPAHPLDRIAKAKLEGKEVSVTPF